MSGNGVSWAVCKSAPRSRQITTSPLSFLQAGCPSCRPANSVKALKAQSRLSHTVRKFEYLQKLSYFPLGLCPKLRTLKILPQVDRVVNEIRRSRRRRWSLLATPTAVGLYNSRRVVAVYYKSINCNPRTPYCYLLWIFVVQLVSAVNKILTDIARRAVRLRQQSFFLSLLRRAA